MSLEDPCKQPTLRNNGIQWRHVRAKIVDETQSDPENIPSEQEIWDDTTHGPDEAQYPIRTPYVNLRPYKGGLIPGTNHSEWFQLDSSLRKCFKGDAWLPYLPLLSSFVGHTYPVHIYPPKLGRILSNYNDNDFVVSDMLRAAETVVPAECECQKKLQHLSASHRAHYIDRYTGHVRTDDPSCIAAAGFPAVATLLGEGRNTRYMFKPSELQTHLEDMWACICMSLHAYVMDTDAYAYMPPNSITAEFTRSDIADALKNQIELVRDDTIRTMMMPYVRSFNRITGVNETKLSRHIQTIHNTYTISVCDKASTRSVIECKLHYRYMVHKRLSSPEMQLLTNSDTTIESLQQRAWSELAKILPMHKIEDTVRPAVRPRYGCARYWLSCKIIKLDSDKLSDAEKASPTVYRCISDTTESISEMGASILAVIGSYFERAYDDYTRDKALTLWNSGVCPAHWEYPRIKYNMQMRDTAEMIRDRSDTHISTDWKGDMKRFFETLPHSTIIWSAMHIWEKVVQLQGYRCVHVNMHTKTARLIKCRHPMPYRPNSHILCINRETYESLQRYVLEHTYVRFGDRGYIQIKGAPMGASNSPNSSHNVLSTRDEYHMDELVRNGEYEAAARWKLFYRVVDDMHWGNNPTVHADLARWGTIDGQSIWDHLSYEDEVAEYATTSPGCTVGVVTHMCDITIRLNPTTGKSTYELYDKTHHLGALSARLGRYPNHRSQLPSSIKRGVIISQMSRIYTKSSTESFFLRDAMRMMLRMHFNEIPLRHIMKALNSWFPRQTIHLDWIMTFRTRSKLLYMMVEHSKTFGSRPNKAEICKGTSNPSLEEYIAGMLEKSEAV